MHYKRLSLLIFCFCFLISCSSQHELEWQQEEGYRWAELKPGSRGATGFRALSASRTNIDFRNDVSDDIVAENRHYLNGSGVAVGDINGNGLVDIYFANLRGPNRLYKNLGNYRFEDITDEAGVAHEGYNSTGVVFADVNGNGHLDLIISSLSDGNALYLNDGTGKFRKQEESGLGDSRGAHTLALADINGNGLPDLYITNYKVRTARDMYSAQELSFENTMEVQDGELIILPPFDEDFVLVETEVETFRNEIGEPDELYINLGDGRFELADPMEYFFDEQGEPRGLTPDWGLTSAFRDVTGNGLPDLYVANDFWTPDRFWINQGDGTFRLIDREAIRNMSFSSMGVDFSDINRNGHLDFVITEMLSQKHTRRLQQSSEYLPEYEGRTMYSRNSVYLNRGDMTFAQIAWYSGLQATEWSWATYFLDINLNGYEDLIVATGFGRDYQDMDTQIAMYHRDMGMPGGGDILDYPELRLPNRFFRNNGDLTFTDMSLDWGFDVEDMSLGMALADLNNDGDMDIIINRLNDEAVIYENRTNAPRIAVRLKGVSPNTRGIGARIELTGGSVDQSKEITSGGNYLSGPQAQAVFAADRDDGSLRLTVHWPGERIVS
jgi:enediyne biosynthesis protein E4